MIASPEVAADGSVTFRFRDPNAKTVTVNLEGHPKPLEMQKDADGVWSYTTEPLEPDFYGYSFTADGVNLTDPLNSMMKPNLLHPGNMVHVPGPSTLPWEVNDVPHGVIHHHFYKSQIVGDQCDYYVYTPPGYDPTAKAPYPVLYLLHGFSDDASGWTAIGFANVILDNLIAEGKATPMVVVMPLGYGAPEFVKRRSQSGGGYDNVILRQLNFDKFREALLQEVMPAAEASYNISKDRETRAVAGLSMGGAETLLVGLNNLDKFSWVGAYSSGRMSGDFNQDFPGLDSKANSKLSLLWVSCGKDDHLLEPNTELRDWLKSKQIDLKWVVTPGAHMWPVWRRNLAEFAQLLFKKPEK